MQKTWKPITAGILSIIGGIVGLFIGVGLAVLGGSMAMIPELPAAVTGAFAGVGAVSIITGIVAIIGGIYALRRKKYGLALAGCICCLVSTWFLFFVVVPLIVGILAIVFVVMGKGEFAQSAASSE